MREVNDDPGWFRKGSSEIMSTLDRQDLPTEIEKVLPEWGVHRGPVTPHKNPCEGVN